MEMLGKQLPHTRDPKRRAGEREQRTRRELVVVEQFPVGQFVGRKGATN
jgi:hypothetical protein